jgi:ER-bound oxygenase mpaB/B'/Rubber oxygenase, catalytic domain
MLKNIYMSAIPDIKLQLWKQTTHHMKYFVAEDNIVRKIWGKADNILLIFAGAAAEFALNKSVDWLYFTGKLPADPIGRLFSTVAYARQIIFEEEEKAFAAIDRMRVIHSSVEKARVEKIPDWAYRDVLFMLIHYSIASYEVLETKLAAYEKEAVFTCFNKVGTRMGIKDLPDNYMQWKEQYAIQLKQNLQRSILTDDLFLQYKKQLGNFRYRILIESQKLVISAIVADLLRFKRRSLLKPVIPIYRVLRKYKLDAYLKKALLPSAYLEQTRELDKNIN